ncbi:hypothetical protein EK904_014112 [Melospiza melodia maxima]|nr:hypothetical protein EK904_014112 [Melospiza melodia maxima]
MNSCFKCKIKPTFPLESQVISLLLQLSLLASRNYGSEQSWNRSEPSQLCPVSNAGLLGVPCISCASCQHSWELPAPVPSRLLLPSWGRAARALQGSVSPLVHPCGTCRGQHPCEERADRSLQRTLGFSRSLWSPGLAAPAQGELLLPPRGQNSPTIKERKVSAELSRCIHTSQDPGVVFGKLLDAHIMQQRAPCPNQDKPLECSKHTACLDPISITAITSKGKPSQG